MRTLVLVIATVLLLTACGGRAAQQPPAAPAGEQAVTIKMSEFKFDPATVQVRGGKVKFELTNAGTVEHSFVIVGTGKKVEAIQPGKGGQLEIDLKPGTYQVECDIPGHKEAGMIMTIVVK